MNYEVWLKNLAQARFVDEAWEHKHPRAVDEAYELHVNEALPQLYQFFEDAAQIYNAHTCFGSEMRVLGIEAPDQAGFCGFQVLLGRGQLRVEQEADGLQVQFSKWNGFEQESLRQGRYKLEADPFGGLLWLSDGGSLLGSELLARTLLEELVKTTPLR